MRAPRVTVLMTVYNGMPYLPQAIESILDQTWSDFEFLIVDDASTDESRDVMRSYQDPRIRVLRNDENLMQTRSLNRGLAESRGELVARMDADDVSHPTRLEEQVRFLDEHPDVIAAGVNFRLIDDEGNVVGRSRAPENDTAIRWVQLFRSPIACGAVMFRKSAVWDRLGGFEPSVHLAQDWELWSRVPRDDKLANLPGALLDVRRHSGSESISRQELVEEEQRRIVRLNVERILEMEDAAPEFDRKLDTLVGSRVDAPGRLLDVLEEFHHRFCGLYPGARDDPAVREEMAVQCLRALYGTDLRNPAAAFRTLRLLSRFSQLPGAAFHCVRWLASASGAARLARSVASAFRFGGQAEARGPSSR